MNPCFHVNIFVFHLAGLYYLHINQYIIWLVFQVEPFQWNGEFCQAAETILTQHLVQCGMSAVSVTLAQWSEFASVHVEHPLSFIVFSLLLQKLVKPLQNGLITDDEVTK
jgi:hypothetical protein